MTGRPIRIGQIVPSSNTTMETEVPGMLRLRETVAPERFTFHSSRMRMLHVSREELAVMDGESDRCAVELSDAAVDVIAYACLVAIMATGLGYHAESERRLRERTAANGLETPVITSAGALVEGVRALGAKRIAVVTPYAPALTDLVIEYLENERFQVGDRISLNITDNRAVGTRDPLALVKIAERLDLANTDAIILSACVQMPSHAAIAPVQERTGLPVLTASAATVYALLRGLQLPTHVPDSGALLDGTH